MRRGDRPIYVSPRIRPWSKWSPRWSGEGVLDEGIHTEDGRSDRVNVEWPKSVGDVNAVTPQVRLADECLGEADSGLSADRVGGIVVRVDVVVE